MMKIADTTGYRSLLFWLLLALSAALFLLNLGNHYLWQDEAQTALVSKTVLKYGIPKGFDGLNYLSQELGAEYGENYVWKWHTWLSFYVVAGSFKLFGINTFAARLPFALFGMASVFMVFALCRALWNNRRIAYWAVFLLALCVPFLLLSRQCRWYSMAAFFCLWGLHSYLGIVEKKKRASLFLVLSLFFLFHTHYIYCAMLLVTVGLHALFFHRNRIVTLAIPCAIVVLVNLPWIYWFMDIRYGDRYSADWIFDSARIMEALGRFLGYIGNHVFSPYLLLVLPLAAAGHWLRTRSLSSLDKKFWRQLVLLLLFVAVNLGVLMVVSPGPHFRYLAPLVPVCVIFVALIVAAAARVHVLASVVVAAVVTYFGAFGDFLYEITHDYDGPIEAIANYLNEHGDKDDLVLISYGDLPLKFYTPMRVVGGLTGEDLSPYREPDWLIARRHLGSSYVRRVLNHLQTIPLDDYEKIELDCPDICYENREVPDQHRFRTVIDVNVDRKKARATDEENVILYRRIKQP